jgi:hypothetical protein
MIWSPVKEGHSEKESENGQYRAGLPFERFLTDTKVDGRKIMVSIAIDFIRLPSLFVRKAISMLALVWAYMRLISSEHTRETYLVVLQDV